MQKRKNALRKWFYDFLTFVVTIVTIIVKWLYCFIVGLSQTTIKQSNNLGFNTIVTTNFKVLL